MIASSVQLAGSVISERLRQRLETLGVTVLSLLHNGQTQAEGASRWIEQTLIESAPFIAAVRERWAQLGEQSGSVVELWEGLWLVPLPTQRRRRLAGNQFAQPILAAMLLGPELLSSDRMRLVCDTQQLDFHATIARVDHQQLVGSDEAQRLASTLAWMHEDATEIERRSVELQSMSQELAESYEELSLLYKLSSNMTVNQPPANFLTEACRELQQVVGLKFMALQLVDQEPRLQDLAGGVFTAGPADADLGALKRVGVILLEQYGSTNQPIIIDDSASLNIAELAEMTENLLVIPLRVADKPLGILFGGEKLDRTHINSVDSKLCDSLANSMTIFLENMMLYADVQSMFLGTLHALTRAIDAKDSYTHGHSERVALMSRRLAAAAGLDEPTVERIYIAGLVHDVGKIGVPEAVLCKPGKLTDEEFDLIKRHPEIGARILQDIRQMQDLVPGVLHHHERWDGRGYPHRLQANDIPLFGRVIGLADAFDAMSSHRTYRSAMSHEQVLAEVQRCSGTQFDAELVQIFLKLDFSEYFNVLTKHQNEQVRQSA